VNAPASPAKRARNIARNVSSLTYSSRVPAGTKIYARVEPEASVGDEIRVVADVDRRRRERVRPDRAAVAFDRERAREIEIEAEAIVRGREPDAHERLVGHHGERLRAVLHDERIARVPAGERHRATEPAVYVEIVHDDPPAARRRRLEALERETRLRARAERDARDEREREDARTLHESSRRTRRPDRGRR
jgi:hypothetical protein